jgi:hypothetical protein
MSVRVPASLAVDHGPVFNVAKVHDGEGDIMLERRDVLKNLGLLPAALGGAASAQEVPKAKLAPASANHFVNQTVNRKNVVATQVKAYAWLDEGVDRLLDNLQQKGNVNTVFAFTYLSDPTDIVTGAIPIMALSARTSRHRPAAPITTMTRNISPPPR